jgi:hypothetical protein
MKAVRRWRVVLYMVVISMVAWLAYHLAYSHAWSGEA